MKYLTFALSLLLTCAVFYGLNTKLGSVPPLGKFLSPFTGVWQNESDDEFSGEIRIDGLKMPVTVHYDAQLIPHVFAENDSDLYRAQGYITAKHRLWQLEFQTFAAAGRLSEIAGEAALNYDRQQRRKGMAFGAERILKKIEDHPETFELLQAYAGGVNAYIDQLEPKDYPVEYKLLDYSPEPWTPLKTALFMMNMIEDLSGSESDLEYTNALRIFGKERFDLLFPDFFDRLDPIIPKDNDWSFIETEMVEVPETELPLDSIVETIDKPHPDNGSNNWAISGDKSYSGHPILANDPHLGLKLPSIWFVMQLRTPDHNSFGATLPGALGVVSGFNNFISWGETNATRDVLDWYKIQFKDDNRLEYLHDGTWKKAELRVEEISIRGGESFRDTVRYTHHGPVTYDRNFKHSNPRSGYAMKWTGHDGGNVQRIFLELNKAKNYDDYVEALKHHRAGAQNFVFASTQGDIAIWIQGLFPNKWKGQGKFLMDGTNPAHDWQSYIPQPYNAHTKNPERGFVSSANQHPVDQAYPFYVFNDGYETYRNRVINNFLDSKEKMNMQDFKDLQNNNFNLKAAELLPYMLSELDSSGLSQEELEVLEQVRTWDYYNDIDLVGPSIWTAWWNSLEYLVWDEFRIENTALETPFDYQTVYLLKNKGNDAFMDIQETPEVETATDLFLISFKQAAQQVKAFKDQHENYNWGDYKGTYVGHLLQALPAFSRLNVGIGGDRGIVNATSKNHGPSWRMIVEMSSPPKAVAIYPGGQSGNPGSKYYDNFVDDWAVGKYHELNFMQSPKQETGLLGTQILKPKS